MNPFDHMQNPANRSGGLPYHRDNFVRSLVTDPAAAIADEASDDEVVEEVPLSPPAGDGESVLTLPEIKLHCRIELDQETEDSLLIQYERAAHVHTANYLRRPGELDSAAPENVKHAMLVLIAHWYRNREAVGDEKLASVPLAYDALLSGEREYSYFY